jgi:hypothetical protein
VQQIRSLTALRGMAALIILLHHTFYFLVPDLQKTVSSATRFIDNGYLAVDFFFILSGFILAYVYVRQFESSVSLPTYRVFLFSRFACLYPPHFLMLLPFIGVGLLDMLGIPGVARCVIEGLLGVLVYKAYRQSDSSHTCFRRPDIFVLAVIWVSLVMHYSWYDTLTMTGSCLLILSSAVRDDLKLDRVRCA